MMDDMNCVKAEVVQTWRTLRAYGILLAAWQAVHTKTNVWTALALIAAAIHAGVEVNRWGKPCAGLM